MKRLLLSALCATVALSLVAPAAQAQAPANGTTGTTTSGGTSGSTGSGLGMRHRGGGEGLEEKHAREIIRKYDTDGDHALNATELAAFFEALHQRVEERRSKEASSSSTSTTTSPSAGKGQHSGGSPQEHATRAIEKFDKNGDGKLEVGEVAAMLRAIRERLEERGGQHRGATTTATNNT